MSEVVYESYAVSPPLFITLDCDWPAFLVVDWLREQLFDKDPDEALDYCKQLGLTPKEA